MAAVSGLWPHQSLARQPSGFIWVPTLFPTDDPVLVAPPRSSARRPLPELAAWPPPRGRDGTLSWPPAGHSSMPGSPALLSRRAWPPKTLAAKLHAMC